MNNLLTEFVQEIDASEELINGIKILQSGKLVDEYFWKEDVPKNVHSIGKNFTSTAVGLAIEEGLLRIDETLEELFPNYVTEQNIQSLSELTVHHLLTMGIGQKEQHLMIGQRELIEEKDFVAYSLNQKFVYAPGETFLYSNVGPYLAGMAVQKRAGMDLVAYLEPRLFSPLGITDVKWGADPKGNTFGAGDLYIKLSDLSKYTQLYLQNGKWEGTQLISTDWIELSKIPHKVSNSEDPYTDYYGYSFWISPDKKIYRGDGAFGQLAMIIPEKETTIVIVSEKTDNVRNMEKIFRLIYPRL